MTDFSLVHDFETEVFGNSLEEMQAAADEAVEAFFGSKRPYRMTIAPHLSATNGQVVEYRATIYRRFTNS